MCRVSGTAFPETGRTDKHKDGHNIMKQEEEVEPTQVKDYDVNRVELII